MTQETHVGAVGGPTIDGLQASVSQGTEMNADLSTSTQPGGNSDVATTGGQQCGVHVIHDEQCAAQPAVVPGAEPTGADVLASAGRPINPDQLILQLLAAGGMEEIRLDERVNLALGNKFVLGVGDRLFRFTINGKQYEWPFRLISGSLVLELAGGGQEHRIELTREGVKSRIAPDELVDLSHSGVEQFKTLMSVGMTIIVNMTEVIVHEHELSYGQLAHLAYPQDPPADHSDIVYTITVSYHEGPTVPVVRGGKPVHVQKGMVCNVRKTTRS
ncbi:MAG: multiubiquitin domain-containing protein [Burkholderiaceae bacterium]